MKKMINLLDNTQNTKSTSTPRKFRKKSGLKKKMTHMERATSVPMVKLNLRSQS